MTEEGRREVREAHQGFQRIHREMVRLGCLLTSPTEFQALMTGRAYERADEIVTWHNHSDFDALELLAVVTILAHTMMNGFLEIMLEEGIEP